MTASDSSTVRSAAEASHELDDPVGLDARPRVRTARRPLVILALVALGGAAAAFVRSRTPDPPAPPAPARTIVSPISAASVDAPVPPDAPPIDAGDLLPPPIDAGMRPPRPPTRRRPRDPVGPGSAPAK